MGYKVYRNEKGQLHRIDGPAFINDNIQSWFMNGIYHRIDGPAIIDNNHQSWWINDKLIINPDEYIHEEIKNIEMKKDNYIG